MPAIPSIPSQRPFFIAEAVVNDGGKRSLALELVNAAVAAGALARLRVEGSGLTWVVNGHVLTNLDYGALSAHLQRQNLDRVNGVSRNNVEVPYSIIRIDRYRLFCSVEEKPRLTELVAAGACCLSTKLFALLANNCASLCRSCSIVSTPSASRSVSSRSTSIGSTPAGPPI